jgi:putative lipase involved disintegration of autophagic bodies
MGVQEIPKQYKYVCDICKKEHIQENANGHYWESTPEGWSSVRVVYNHADVINTGYKRHGVENILLCPSHASNLYFTLGEVKK